MPSTVRVASIVTLALVIAACGERGPDIDAISRSVEQQLASEAFLSQIVEGEDDAYSDEIAEFYRARAFQPAWVRAGEPTVEMQDAAEAFCSADTAGLWPADYASPQLATLYREAYDAPPEDDSLHAQKLAQLDIAFTEAYMDYASDLLTGRLDPRNVGSGWNTPVHEIDLVETVVDAESGNPQIDLGRHLSTRHSGFAQLHEALQHYRRIREEGGWPEVPPGEALETGSSGERVAALRQRLAVTGDLARSDTASADSASFDTALAAAVARFQDRHGLTPDSVAGDAVFEAMNVPVDERIRQIELNLERWRWIPDHLGRRYLYVNVPAFQLHAFEGDEQVLNMRVVVGQEYEDQATPVFSDTMQYVVFRPYWNVPQSIASEEILPRARQDRGYLARNNYEVVSSWSQDARVFDAQTADLDRVESGTYRIRQRPGPWNALGNIKFMFPNEFNIYLHDTPETYLFERAERAYSHGCIRVENPVELAEFVFQDPSMSADEIQRRMQSGGGEETVNLNDPLPVYILYWTAFVDSDGRLNFRSDLYGQDEALSEALDAQRPSGSADEVCRLLGSNDQN